MKRILPGSAADIIAKECVRDLLGEHEMGMRIIGEKQAMRIIEALNAAGFEIARKASADAG